MLSYIKTAKLKSLEKNPRTITDASFKKLCKSLEDNEQYFEARPLIISDRTGEMVVLAGNQRLKAAIKIRMDKVPCFVMSGLTKEKEDEIIIRDNVSSGDWDMDVLANEFEFSDLIEWDVPVPKDWNHIPSDDEPEGDTEPPKTKPVVKLEILFDDLDYYQHCKERLKEFLEDYPGAEIVEPKALR